MAPIVIYVRKMPIIHKIVGISVKLKMQKNTPILKKIVVSSKKKDVNFTKKKGAYKSIIHTCLNSHQKSNHIWYIGTGCLNHMTDNKKSFVSLYGNIKAQITLGDGSNHDVDVKGDNYR